LKLRAPTSYTRRRNPHGTPLREELLDSVPAKSMFEPITPAPVLDDDEIVILDGPPKKIPKDPRLQARTTKRPASSLGCVVPPAKSGRKKTTRRRASSTGRSPREPLQMLKTLNAPSPKTRKTKCGRANSVGRTIGYESDEGGPWVPVTSKDLSALKVDRVSLISSKKLKKVPAPTISASPTIKVSGQPKPNVSIQPTLQVTCNRRKRGRSTELIQPWNAAVKRPHVKFNRSTPPPRNRTSVRAFDSDKSGAQNFDATKFTPTVGGDEPDSF